MGMLCYDTVSQTMTTPLPLPYVNLVMPTLTAMALMGIDQIGAELENPFGDDVNDLDFQAMIMGLEKEMLRMLQIAGDARARDKFVWLPVPKFMQSETSKPFLWYVA